MIFARCLLFALALPVSVPGFCQLHTKTDTGKVTRFMRVININDSEIDSDNKNFQAFFDLDGNYDLVINYKIKDTTNVPLQALFYDAVQTGKLSAYANYIDGRHLLFMTMYREEFSRISVPSLPDIDPVEDPLPEDGKPIKHVNMPEHFSRVTQLCILFKRTEFADFPKSRIDVDAIGPIKEFWSEDGSSKGRRPLCWLIYGAAKPIIARFEKMHPKCNVLEQIENIRKEEKLKLKKR